MPFYNVYIGFPVGKSLQRIFAGGLPPEIYQGPPVRVMPNSLVTSTYNDTVIAIECADEQIANQWRDALINAIGEVEQYIPPVPGPGADPPRPADDVWSRVGTWTKTVGNATTVISGLPGQPKGLILVGSGKAGATINTFSDYGGLVFGFTDGVFYHRLGSICAQDNVATQNTSRTINSRPFTLMNETAAGGATITEVADGASFGSTSFTITWSATTLATSGYYFVFGGNDIECKVKDYTIGTTAFGEIEYLELGAMHDFCLLMSNGFAGVGYTQAETGGAVWNLSCHAGHDNTKSWSVALTENDGVTPTGQWRLQKRDRLFSSMFTNGPNQGQIARFKGWLNDGFKIEWQDPPETDTTLFTGLFVKGGNWDAGTFVQPTTNSTFTHILQQDPYQRVKGMMAFSINNIPITNDSGVTGASISIGAQDSAGSKACLAYAGNHGANPSVESTVVVNNAFVKAITPAATASASTTNAECTVSDMATDGQFTINYTTTDSTPRQSVWFTLSA